MVKKAVKTDNASLASKVAIRRWALQRAGIQRPSVLDCCAGRGLIWRAMANAGFPPHRYLPIDKAPRLPGTLKGDITGDNSVLRRVPIADFDCIDIDTYGEPWEPWLRWVAPRLARERTTIVLLTCGRISLGGGTSVSAFSKRLAGIPDDWAITRHPAVAQYLGDFTIRQSAVVAEIEAAAQIVLPRVTYFALLARGRTALPA